VPGRDRQECRSVDFNADRSNTQDLDMIALPHRRPIRVRMTTTIIAMTLALAPPSFDVSDTEATTTDDAFHLLTYDADGEVSAEIVVWTDDRGRLRLDAGFDDGHYLAMVVDGDEVTSDSDDAAEVAARAQAIDDFLATNPAQEGTIWCATGVLAMAGFCGTGNLLGCMVGTATVACHCLPLVMEAEC
jgi:hypothetical protein